MIDLFSLWITGVNPQFYQQPVDNFVNKCYPLLITFFVYILEMWIGKLQF